MRHRKPVVIAVTVLVLSAIAVSASFPIPKGAIQANNPPEHDPDGLQQVAEDFIHRKALPTNGLNLNIKPKLIQRKRGQIVRVGWEFWYVGPRAPLNIIKPCLTQGYNAYETDLRFVAQGKDGKYYAYSFHSPQHITGCLCLPYEPPMSRYLTVPSGQTGKGHLNVPLTSVRDKFCTKKPELFDNKTTPQIYAKLWFSPTDRGHHLSLDAWTGSVESEVLLLEVEDWSKE